LVFSFNDTHALALLFDLRLSRGYSPIISSFLVIFVLVRGLFRFIVRGFVRVSFGSWVGSGFLGFSFLVDWGLVGRLFCSW